MLLEHLRTRENVRRSYIFGEYLHVVFRGTDESLGTGIFEKKEIQPTIEDCFMQLMEQSSMQQVTE